MALDSETEDPASARVPLTVSALNRAVASLLERSFPLVRVRGEISNLTRAASGHLYFALKDDAAQVRCVMFRGRAGLMDWVPNDGDEVEIGAVVSLYQARGDFQLNVESMRRAGLGRLFEEFLRLKTRLAAEGLFNTEMKRALPTMPRSVGVVTSLQAAALQDVLTALRRRAPYLHVVLYPVPVQGTEAAARIAQMLSIVSERSEVDVVVLVRGGGSIEDLWSFNEEVVARAIRASRLPVVVGVGHESDFTIADFAADVRAPTPTAAAEMIAPSRDALLAVIGQVRARLGRQILARLQSAQQRLDYAQRAVIAPRLAWTAFAMRLNGLQTRQAAALRHEAEHARNRLVVGVQSLVRARPARAHHSLRLDAVCARLGAAVARRLQVRLGDVERLAQALAHLDPRAVLARGYAIARLGDGSVVFNAAAVAPDTELDLSFAHGGAWVRVLRTRSD